MIEYMDNFDRIDTRILSALQRDATMSQRDLAEVVGLSQNACWRRIKKLEGKGLIRGSRVLVDLVALGLDLTVFVMLRTRHHSKEWSNPLARTSKAFPRSSISIG